MEVPFAMGRTARAWDEQHLDLQAAAGQVAAAPTGGFTDGVARAAACFAESWQRHVSGLGAAAESRADGLRGSAADYARTDEVVATDHLSLDSVPLEDR